MATWISAGVNATTTTADVARVPQAASEAQQFHVHCFSFATGGSVDVGETVPTAHVIVPYSTVSVSALPRAEFLLKGFHPFKLFKLLLQCLI